MYIFPERKLSPLTFVQVQSGPSGVNGLGHGRFWTSEVYTRSAAIAVPAVAAPSSSTQVARRSARLAQTDAAAAGHSWNGAALESSEEEESAMLVDSLGTRPNTG